MYCSSLDLENHIPMTSVRAARVVTEVIVLKELFRLVTLKRYLERICLRLAAALVEVR